MDQSIDLKLSVDRIMSMKDNFTVGVTRNNFNQMHYWFTHSFPLLVGLKKNKKLWNTSVSYEVDNKHLKYLSRERSLIFRAQPDNSALSFKLESTFRKNLVDQYASRKFIL
jgi:hypothetical protein